MAEASKRCTKCKKEMSISEFYNNRSRPDGRGSQCKACVRLWRESEIGKAHIKAYQKEWANRPENLIRRRIYKNNWDKTPKGKARKARVYHKRFSSLKTLRCDLTAGQWLEIKASQNYRCAMCDEVKPLHRDHIIPVSKGGEFTKNNIQGLCAVCNGKKGNKPPSMAICQAALKAKQQEEK